MDGWTSGWMDGDSRSLIFNPTAVKLVCSEFDLVSLRG